MLDDWTARDDIKNFGHITLTDKMCACGVVDFTAITTSTHQVQILNKEFVQKQRGQ